MNAERPPRAARLDELRETFGGDRQVAEGERKREVNDLFDRIAPPRYDLMNDLMSFGMHRLWKATTVREALRQLSGKPGPLLDLAGGGTGDLALAIKDRDPPVRHVIVADASAGMLTQARARGGDRLEYLHADAEALPLEDASAAVITLAFGLRNMTDPAGALRECARVLAPGGAAWCCLNSRARRPGLHRSTGCIRAGSFRRWGGRWSPATRGGPIPILWIRSAAFRPPEISRAS